MKKSENKKQTMKIPRGGSFQNWLMSNNNTLPVVGEYATIMHYTDRDVAIVRSISKDGMQCVIEDCDTVADGKNLQMGHQQWKHTPSGHTKTLRWYRGKWRVIGREIVFTDEFRKSIDSACIGHYLSKNNPGLFKQVYGNHCMPKNVVPGVTRERKTYNSIRILFGVCNYHYDWTF
jgi:hypothetical protein